MASALKKATLNMRMPTFHLVSKKSTSLVYAVSHHGYGSEGFCGSIFCNAYNRSVRTSKPFLRTK